MFNWHRITLSQTNCYILKAKDGFMLVDCGNAHDKETFLKSIQALGVDIAEMRYLFLTHHHNDHVGLLNDLVSMNPNVKVILSKKCAAYLEAGRHYNHPKQKYAHSMLRLVVEIFAKLNGGFSEEFTPYVVRSQDIVIPEDNDTLLPELGIQGKILGTPGHTEDSISLIMGDVAFVGDAVRNLVPALGAAYLPFLLYDPETCYASWLKITAETKMICPAHGKCFEAEKLRKRLRSTKS